MENKRVASFWIRLIAFWIDVYLFGIITIGMFFFIGLIVVPILLGLNFAQFGDKYGDVWIAVIVQTTGFGVMFLYYVLLNGRFGATFGKMIFKLRIVDENYNNIGFKVAIIRFLLFFISLFLLGIGSLWILIDKRKQSLYDKLLGLNVIDNRVRP